MSSQNTLHYTLHLKGHLGEVWLRHFEGWTCRLTEEGETELQASLPDQAALFGVLRQCRDLGLELMALRRSDHKEEQH
jgi:hypothetical protein